MATNVTPNQYQKTVQIAEVGDNTQEEFVGTFVFRTMLSHRDNLNEDRIRRELLVGPTGSASGEEALNTAAIFAALTVRIINAPTWWTERNNGMDLYDNNVVAKVYAEARKAEADQLAELKAKAEAARAKLRELPPVNGDAAPAPTSAK